MRNTLLAIVLFGACVALAPGHADQNDDHLDTLFELLQTTENRYEGAEITRQIWRRWLEIEDENAAELMETGIAYLDEQKLDKALAIFTRVTEIKPDFAEAWNKRATVYYLLGDYEKSLNDVDKTLSLEPRHFGALSGQALIYLHSGDRISAMSGFRKALSINPFLGNVRRNIEFLERELRQHLV